MTRALIATLPLSKHKRGYPYQRFPCQGHDLSHVLSSNSLTRGTIPAMALKIKIFLLAVLLVFIPLSSGLVDGFRESMHPARPLIYKDNIKMNSRKLFAHDFVLDYDEAGANPKHRKQPGKGP